VLHHSSLIPCIEKVTALTILNPTAQVTPTATTPVATVTFTGVTATPTPYSSSGDLQLANPRQHLLPTEHNCCCLNHRVQCHSGSHRRQGRESTREFCTSHSMTSSWHSQVHSQDRGLRQRGRGPGRRVNMGPPLLPTSSPSTLGSRTITPPTTPSSSPSTTRPATPPLANQNIQFGIFSHDKVIAANQSCATSCVNVSWLLHRYRLLTACLPAASTATPFSTSPSTPSPAPAPVLLATTPESADASPAPSLSAALVLLTAPVAQPALPNARFVQRR
jgi:hypothetical protein